MTVLASSLSHMALTSVSALAASVCGQVELDGAAHPHARDVGPAQAVQGGFDGLALDVEDAGLEEHLDLGFHRASNLLRPSPGREREGPMQSMGG
jgi:hypothetical protein